MQTESAPALNTEQSHGATPQRWWSKLRGVGRSGPRPTAGQIFWSALGTASGMSVLVGLTALTHTPLLIAPLGATCVLAYGLFESPLAQPRNIIGGHLVATLTGFAVLYTLGTGPVALVVAVALALVLMQATKTVHAPAGADPLVVLLTQPSFSFVVAPVLVGAFLLVLVALVFNNLIPGRRYPTYWW